MKKGLKYILLILLATALLVVPFAMAEETTENDAILDEELVQEANELANAIEAGLEEDATEEIGEEAEEIAQEQEPQVVTSELKVSVPADYEDKIWRLTDGNRNSWIQFEIKQVMEIYPDEKASAVLIEWYSLPKNVNVFAQDASGTILDEVSCTGLYENLINLPNGCTKLLIASSNEFAVCEISVLSAAEAEAYIPLEIPEKVDLMLVCAHQADETAWMTGVVPYYAGVKGLKTISLYLSVKNRQAIKETLDVQRMYGETSQPVFFTENKYYFMTEQYASFRRRIWDYKTNANAVTANIRQFKPEVIATLSSTGEHEDAMHRYALELTEEAIARATQDNMDKDSYKAYGLWTVSKLYSHIDEDANALGSTLVELDARMMTGDTVREASQKALEEYDSISIYQLQLPEKSEFRLAKSEVGDDITGLDFFDNIPADSLTNKGEYPVIDTSVTEEQDTAEESVLETDVTYLEQEGTETETETEPETVKETSIFSEFFAEYDIIVFIVMAVAILFAAALVFLLIKLKAKKVLLLTALIPLLAGLILCGMMYFNFVDARNSMITPAAPVEKTEEVEELETEEVEDKDDKYFRQEGEEAEVVVQDDENGHWEYRSDTLSILIDRTSTTVEGNKPLVYYVAHIRMRDINAYRSGFGYFNEAGSGKEKPYEIARRDRAVLAFTGDNLVNSGVRNKGVLIRKGRLYFKGTKNQATLALLDDMSLKIYEKGTNAYEVLQDGVQDSYGFGPILVQDSTIHPDTLTNHLKKINPRCGIGMVEPGHLVAIVVDGRQRTYSVGVTLYDFAQMFLDQGCTLAFNMDGGVSAGMVFMGEHINRHAKATGKTSSQRPWPDALEFGYSELVPSLDDPIINTGNGVEADRNKRKAAEAAAELEDALDETQAE